MFVPLGGAGLTLIQSSLHPASSWVFASRLATALRFGINLKTPKLSKQEVAGDTQTREQTREWSQSWCLSSPPEREASQGGNLEEGDRQPDTSSSFSTSS